MYSAANNRLRQTIIEGLQYRKFVDVLHLLRRPLLLLDLPRWFSKSVK